MNIFFSASLHGKPKYGDHYEKMLSIIEAKGHKVVADHIMKTTPEDLKRRTPAEDEAQFKKILDKIKKCDAMFVELSHPSTSVGFFIAQAFSLGKPVVIFFSGVEEPHVLKNLESLSEKMAVVRYRDIVDLASEVPLMLNFVAESQDTRFNFFVSPHIASYLDWVAKEQRLPRSVYLRKLIDEDMQKNREYQG